MNKTDMIFVKVLDNYINCKSCKDIDFSEVDREKLVELVRKHRLIGIFYSCIKDTNIDKEVLDIFEKGFCIQIALFQRRHNVINLLKQMFDNNKIEHIWIKGSHIASLYPHPELRSMSDLDIIIHKEDINIVHNLLINKGAEYLQVESDSSVNAYKLQGVNLEIHSNLVSDKVWINGVDFNGYFKDVFSHTNHQDGYSYVLDNEFNLIYSIFHIAKHFYGSGCGIRMLLDLPVMVRNFEGISWNRIWKELDELKLTGFAERIFALSEKWFGSFQVEYNKKVGLNDIEIVENFILAGGVYGLDERNTDAVQIKYHGGERDGGYSYLKGMLKWAFPSCKEMRQCSLWFTNKPSIMLPFAYIERFVRNAKERGGILKWGKSVVTGRKELDEKDTILSIMKLR